MGFAVGYWYACERCPARKTTRSPMASLLRGSDKPLSSRRLRLLELVLADVTKEHEKRAISLSSLM